MSTALKPRAFGSNLSNKAEPSATPVAAKAAAALKPTTDQKAKLAAQHAKLEEWQKLKREGPAAAAKPPAAAAVPTKRPVGPLSTPSVAAAPGSALSTPTHSAKQSGAGAANQTAEIFYTPSSSPTSFKQRTAAAEASSASAAATAAVPMASLDPALDELRRVNGELRDRIAALESGTELAELRARNSDLERLAGELRSLNGELRRANARLREIGTSAADGANERLQARILELEQALAHANSDIDALRAAARDAAAGAPADLAALEQSLRDAKQALGRARADARIAQQDADEARGALQAATEALDAADEEQSALRREADEAREQLAQQQERAARVKIAEAAAAAGRTLATQQARGKAAIVVAVERSQRSLTAVAAAGAARARVKAAPLPPPPPPPQQQQQSEAGANKRLSTATELPVSKRATVDSGTQTSGWSREQELDCLRFSHDLLVQKMAEMRGQFTQKLQHMHKLQDAVEQRRQNEAQEWSEMLTTTVEALKTQMASGLKESVLRVRQLQNELESEQQLNERLAGELEQLRNEPGHDGADAASASSPVARALERLREQLGSSRSRVDELESENELLMEKLVEYETRSQQHEQQPPLPDNDDDDASVEPRSPPAPTVDPADEERVAAQRDAMECFPSMENVTMTRRGRGRK